VIEELKKFGGEFRRYQFTKYGLNTWRLWRLWICLNGWEY
jgi:hypothetical protein